MYGFKDKEVALKLKKMATGGGAPNAAGESASNNATSQTLDIVNVSGADIPPFGLVFASKGVSSAGIPALNAFTYAAIKDAPNIDRFIPLFNVGDTIPSGQYGSAQFAGEYFYCLIDGALPNVGASLYPSDSVPYKLSTDGDPAGGGWSYVSSFSPDLFAADTSSDVSLVRVLSGAPETVTAFFYTGDTGIPAASNKFQPNKAEIEKRRFDPDTGEIKALDPQEHEDVYNHTLSAVGKEKLVQAKKINGAWFIDVEPCSGGA